MVSNTKKNSLEALNLILDPIVVIDKDYNVVFANAEAVKQFGKNKNLPCYKYIYGLKEPCWKYAGYFCPIKEAQKETDKKLTYIQYAPKDGLYRKYLLKGYIHDDLYVECFVPLKEVLEIIKERPSVGKKHDGTYLSKQEFEVLLNDLLAKGKNFYLIAVNIKKLKYVNYPASEMRSFGWDCTRYGVPYHHGRVHTAPTPAYPTIQWDSGATLTYIPALGCWYSGLILLPAIGEYVGDLIIAKP